MSKNLIGQDENDLLEIQPAGEPTLKNIAAARVSKTDDAENLLEIPELAFDATNNAETPETTNEPIKFDLPNETKIEESRPEKINEPFFQTPVEPESIGETARKSGLAYGAAVTLFGSVIFMLLLGWFADWLLGTAPWGIVVGIVLGAAIGFYQFFRITSQIFKNKD